MPLYKPHGVRKNQVIDPKELSEEWLEADNIVKNCTNWQFLSGPQSGMFLNQVAENGSAVKLHQVQKYGFAGAGYPNTDADYLYNGISGTRGPWQIPYMRGFQNIWNDNLSVEWTSTTSELVLIGLSCWVYRLSDLDETSARSESLTDSNIGYDADAKTYNEAAWQAGVKPRIKFGLRLDGSIIDGSGPGRNVPTNAPENINTSGSREKGICSSSTSIHVVPAGTHKLFGVAAQGPAIQSDRTNYWHIRSINDFSRAATDRTPDIGVAVINARLHVIRFPRGKVLR